MKHVIVLRVMVALDGPRGHGVLTFQRNMLDFGRDVHGVVFSIFRTNVRAVGYAFVASLRLIL